MSDSSQEPGFRARLRQYMAGYEKPFNPQGKTSAVAAPVAPVVPSPPVSAAAQPEKPAAGAAAVVPPSAEVPEVWERGDKYARGAVPKPTAIAADVVMVKGHERALPGTVEKAKEPLTLDVLVKEFERDQEQTTARALRLGRLSDSWIREQSERPEESKLDRASAIKVVRRRLAQAKIDAWVDRYIRCFWVAQLFGGKAGGLSFSAIREMQPFVSRDRDTEKWRVVTTYETAARALWEKMLAEKLPVAEVRAEVRKILPAKSLPIRRKKIKFAVLLKAVPTISREERLALIRRCEEENARAGQSAVA